jgi:predicted TIM-barrel fold metal-dependent hydrolase
MSVPEREAASSVSDLDVVVSADEHISEEVSDFFPYIDESTYGGIKRVIEQASEPWREVFSVTPPLPPFSNTPMASDYSGAGNVMAKAGGKLETKLMRLDEFDIDYAVLNPTLMVALPTVNNPQAAAALVDGYNEWVYETFVAESDRLSMAIVVPGQKPRMGAEEIEKWGNKDGVVAVQVGATGHRIPVSHEWWDPIYAAAEEAGLPVKYHSSFPAMSHAFPLQHRWHELFAQDKVVAHPFSHMWNLTKLLYEGVPQKFPELEFVFQEAGIGWIPYWRMRLDRYHLALGQEMPMLDKLPTKYINDRFYFTTQPVGHSDRNDEHIAWMAKMAGPENLMYSADIPHTDFDAPEELFTPIKSRLEPDEVRGMMGETAMDVFGLGD